MFVKTRMTSIYIIDTKKLNTCKFTLSYFAYFECYLLQYQVSGNGKLDFGEGKPSSAISQLELDTVENFKFHVLH